MAYNFIYYGKRNGLEIFYDDIPEKISISTIIAALGVDTYKINIQSQSPMLRFQRIEVAPTVWRDIISWYGFSLDNRNRRGYHALSLVFETSPTKNNMESILWQLKQGEKDAERLKNKEIGYEEAYHNLINPKISKTSPPRNPNVNVASHDALDNGYYLTAKPVFVNLSDEWGIPKLENLLKRASAYGFQDLIISKIDVVEGQSYHTYTYEQFLGTYFERAPLSTSNDQSIEDKEESTVVHEEKARIETTTDWNSTTKNTLRFKDEKLPLVYTGEALNPLKVSKDKKGDYYIAKQTLEFRLPDTEIDFIDQNNKPVKSKIGGDNNYLSFKIHEKESIQAINDKTSVLKSEQKAFGVLVKNNQKLYAQTTKKMPPLLVQLEKEMSIILHFPKDYPVLIKEKSDFSLSALRTYLGSFFQTNPAKAIPPKKKGIPYKRIMLVLLAGVLLAAVVKYVVNIRFTPPAAPSTEQQPDLRSPTPDTQRTAPPNTQVTEPAPPSIELSAEDKVLYEEAKIYRISARTQLNAKAYDGVRKIFDRGEIEKHIRLLGGVKSPSKEVTKLIEELFEINNDYHQNGYSKEEYELIQHKVKISPKTEKAETTTEIAKYRNVTVAEIIKYNPRDVDENGRIKTAPDGKLPTLVIYRKLN